MARILFISLTLLLFATIQAAWGTQPAPGIRPAGTVRLAGKQIFEKRGNPATPLADGRVFLYGSDFLELDAERLGPSRNLRERLQRLRTRPPNPTPPPTASFVGPLLWNPNRGGWKKIAPAPECDENHAPALHTATALSDGKILIAGGLCDELKTPGNPSPQAPHTRLSIWNGATEQWEPNPPSLTAGRIYHTATLMPDGSLVIVGGQTDPGTRSNPDGSEPVLSSVERYRDGKVEPLPSLMTARAGHTATVLRNGNLLVAGGYDKTGKAIAAAEELTADGVWHSLPPMKTPRHGHIAVLMANDWVMVAGGENQDGIPIAAMERFEPISGGEWTVRKPLPMPVREHAAIRLPDGDVLLVGGVTLNGAWMKTAMLWDDASQAWHSSGLDEDTAQMPGEHHPLSPVPGPDKTILFFGAENILQWQPGQPGPWPYPVSGKRAGYTATELQDGRILIAGGVNAYQEAAEIFDPATEEFSITGRLNQPRAGHEALRLNDGRVVIAGGAVQTTGLPASPAPNSPEVWHPIYGYWDVIKGIRFNPWERVSLGTLDDGRVMFFAAPEPSGGLPPDQTVYHAWLWSPGRDVVETMTVPTAARAHAGIAILPDGQVVIAGGTPLPRAPDGSCSSATAQGPEQRMAAKEALAPCLNPPERGDAQSHAATEIWDSRTGTIRALTVPNGWRLDQPTALRLRNGKILFTNDTSGNPANQSANGATHLILDPADGTWSQLPPHPERQPSRVVELSDGTLATRSHRLAPGANTWREAPAPPQDDSLLIPMASGRLLSLALIPPHAVTFDTPTNQWRWSATRRDAPLWQTTPATLALADGRLLVVGRVGTAPDSVNSSDFWNPKDRLWRKGPNLNGRYESGHAVQLPSGRVVFLGLAGGRWNCETWSLHSDEWQSCGHLNPPEDGQTPRMALSVLDEGRAAVMMDENQVFLFDESSLAWTPFRFEWKAGANHIRSGTRVTRLQPLGRIFEADGRPWLDASLVAARYWALYGHPQRGYFHFLWDPRQAVWTYVFPLLNPMGPAAALLPDGCALSGPPFRLLDPNTGRITSLNGPGGIEPSRSALAVLTDGTVTLAAATTAAGQRRFFSRRASCAGLEQLDPEDIVVTGDLYSEPPTTLPVEPPLPWWRQLLDAVRNELPAGTSPAELLAWGREKWDHAENYRWIVLAACGPLLIYLLLGFLILPPLRVLRRWINHNPLGRIIIPLPVLPSWLARIVVYSGAIGLLFVTMHYFPMSEQNAGGLADCGTTWPRCVDINTGILKPVAISGMDDDEQPTVPCRYVGVWTYYRGWEWSGYANEPPATFRISLNGDGRLTGFEIEDGRQIAEDFAGYWAVQSKRMIWRPNGISEPDVHLIADESESSFSLREGYVEHSRFVKDQPLEPGACSP